MGHVVTFMLARVQFLGELWVTLLSIWSVGDVMFGLDMGQSIMFVLARADLGEIWVKLLNIWSVKTLLEQFFE